MLVASLRCRALRRQPSRLCFSYRRFVLRSVGHRRAAMSSVAAERDVSLPHYHLRASLCQSCRLRWASLQSFLMASRSDLLNCGQIGSRRWFSTSRQANASQSSNSNKNDDENGIQNSRRTMMLKALIWGISTWITLILLHRFLPHGAQEETLHHLVSWNEFYHFMLAAGEVEEIVVRPDIDVVTIALADGAIIKGRRVENRIFHMQVPNVHRFEEQLRSAERSLGISADKGVSVIYERNYDATWLLLFALILSSILILRLFRGSQAKGAMGFGGPFDIFGSIRKAKFRLIDPTMLQTGSPHIKFAEVAGLHEAKIEIKEFVDYLKRPEVFMKLGAKLPKGALLLGPPGCGKTLLAKAVATEASVPFLAVNGTEFIEMIGGLGAARVRDLFAEAKRRAPCIIYIDEIDALGRKRSGSSMGDFAGTSEEEQTLNQLLVELDGMDTAQGVIVMASTNRADMLDNALLRRGRFDRHVNIDLPTKIERKETFDLYLKKIKLARNVRENLSDRLAKMTPGFSGADINNVCNESALQAATAGKDQIEESDIMRALERIIAGSEKKSQTITQEEKKTIAYHETGHALVGWMLKYTDALLKITIVPRTGAALGFAQYNPADRKLFSKEELFDRMCMTLGGLAAETLMFGSVSTGAEDDLRRVTRSAYDQVRVYGMNETVGPLSFAPPPGEERSSEFVEKPYSRQLHALMDQEARKMVFQAYAKAEQILRDNKDKLTKVADELLRAETLQYDDIRKLIGPPAYGEKKAVESVELELPHGLEPTEGSGSPEFPEDAPGRRGRGTVPRREDAEHSD